MIRISSDPQRSPSGGLQVQEIAAQDKRRAKNGKASSRPNKSASPRGGQGNAKEAIAARSWHPRKQIARAMRGEKMYR